MNKIEYTAIPVQDGFVSVQITSEPGCASDTVISVGLDKHPGILMLVDASDDTFSVRLYYVKCLIHNIVGGHESTPEVLSAQYVDSFRDLVEEFNRLHAKPKRLVPKKGQQYYTPYSIYSSSCLVLDWRGSESELKRLDAGLVFKDREEGNKAWAQALPAVQETIRSEMKRIRGDW